MQPEEITALFDQQAPSYDRQWERLAGLNGALHVLTAAVLAELPVEARILCVGAGTGVEIISLAERFPGWSFTAIEPSTPMLEVFRRKAAERGILSRCVLHAGFLDTLPAGDPFDAATAFLVSQFILDRLSRTEFFGRIADRLCPGGILVASDLAGDLETADGRGLLDVWFRLMNQGGVSDEALQRMRAAYRRDVAVLPPEDVREIIAMGGFESPVRFFQAGMIHAWFALANGSIRTTRAKR
jgi:tRNA (cmo5U34)-methyltransferase